MKILLTGATGFIGRHAAAALGPGVVHAGRADGDLTDPAAARRLLQRVRPTHILHAAGRRRIPDVKLQWRVHLGATVNLLEAARSLPKPPRIVTVGSAAELLPAGPYACSKRAATMAALSYRHLGLPVIAARLFNVLGPGTPADLAFGAFAEKLSQGVDVLETGGLEAVRDFLDVRDAGRALALLLKKGEPGRLYEVCSGKPVLMRDAALRLIGLSGSRAHLREGSDSGVPRAVGDPRALRALGFKPRFSLDESLRATLG